MRLSLLFGAGLVSVGLLTARAEAAPVVVATILPLQSIAAAVMEGVGEPSLLLPPGASPHAYGLRPSEAAMLERADLVLWVGEGLETFLTRMVDTLAGDARVLALADAPGMELLATRRAGAGEHGSDHHDQADAHGHGPTDMHIWLSPGNGVAIARAVAGELAEIDPANADRYVANAATFAARTGELERELASMLGPVEGAPYIVFHDAYRYFEEAFGLQPLGSVTLSPELAPGARQVAEIRQWIEDLGAVCVFAEPQFEPRLLTSLVDGTDARTGVLDPIGASLAPGADAYPRLLRDLATSLRACLAPGN
jgi:zinc transport system substrate-binding protein